jgi:hypothetical protein
LPRVYAYGGPAIRFGQLSLEADDAAIGRKLNTSLARIARNERADRPGEGRDVSAADESVE